MGRILFTYLGNFCRLPFCKPHLRQLLLLSILLAPSLSHSATIRVLKQLRYMNAVSACYVVEPETVAGRFNLRVLARYKFSNEMCFPKNEDLQVGVEYRDGIHLQLLRTQFNCPDLGFDPEPTLVYEIWSSEKFPFDRAALDRSKEKLYVSGLKDAIPLCK